VDLQQPIDYLKMFAEMMQRRAELTIQRDKTELEIAKLRKLIIAIFPLLPEDKQKSYSGAMEEMEAENSGLQDAIRLVFSVHKGEWLTPSNVRDYLTEQGFDFREYKANPLASIGTTLRRMAPSILEAQNSAEGTAYMRRVTFLDQMAAEHPLKGVFGRPKPKLGMSPPPPPPFKK
jgi:hypothetical protein